LQLATLLSLFISVSAWGFGPQSIFDQDGQRLPDREVNSGRVAWELLSIRQHGEFGAMGLLSAGFFGGGCSATLIDNGGPDQSPAYIVTNGHCLMNGYPQPGEFIVDRAPARGMSFTARYFRDAGGERETIQVARVEYATMTGTDMALMRLAATRGEVARRGLRGFPIARHAPALGEAVVNVGIPQSGVRDRYLRRSRCEILEQVDLEEGGWEFTGSFRNKCSVVGGSSGSSLVSSASGEVVALINTGVSDSTPTPCRTNHPCEVTKGGSRSSRPEFNYAQRVHELASCFDGQGVFRINDPQCRLQR
ncbi:MAG: trypsin-like peptidase domain-containing protein, partial [Bdellovibrionales bacterium]|nr:trypsin-like peptidase domain-containing protein [Bdellovibrionales bacterium]